VIFHFLIFKLASRGFMNVTKVGKLDSAFDSEMFMS